MQGTTVFAGRLYLTQSVHEKQKQMSWFLTWPESSSSIDSDEESSSDDIAKELIPCVRETETKRNHDGKCFILCINLNAVPTCSVIG